MWSDRPTAIHVSAEECGFHLPARTLAVAHAVTPLTPALSDLQANKAVVATRIVGLEMIQSKQNYPTPLQPAHTE